ncbi:hypothetical protein JRG66_08650 [Salinimicrobium tongyeongense]|jgi:uncharacterized membrane protein|uniref:Uncharacterized protein n=1 Tax=Salinimicrobium tongyeongense TaxID=2809707 RepID=A0ABY6NMG2_9FLAO|nr:hypothetical protein [Salinimicrobium tongyeongense]UZH54072.1 hypothetical protein JRG66_08650 [Salinimicrobium tongyeongense]
MTLHKILKYLALVIGVVGLILWGRVLMAGDDAIENSADVQASVVSPFLYVAYLVFAIIVLLVVFFVIKGLFSGDIKRTLIAVGSFILVVAIAYVLTDGTEKQLRDGTMLSANTDHWVGAGLVTFYILAAAAVLLMVLSGVRKLIK